MTLMFVGLIFFVSGPGLKSEETKYENHKRGTFFLIQEAHSAELLP